MDKGRPFRVPQSTDRRAVNRPEPAHRPPEEPRAASNVPPPQQPASHAAARAGVPPVSKKDDKPTKRFKWLIVAGVIVVIAVAGFFAWSKMQNAGTAIDGSKYQAVFFTNGQVYFGKLHSFNGEYMKLTDIYYLQTQGNQGAQTANTQQTTKGDAQQTLIKLGDEIHGPEDEMIISKKQMLFYENLKDDGKVAQSIEKFKSSK